MIRRTSPSARRRRATASRQVGRGVAAFVVLVAAGCAGNPTSWLRARLELKQGNLRYLAGDYRGAIAHYDRSLLQRPTSASALLNRSYSFMSLFRASDDPALRRGLADTAIVALRGYGACIASQDLDAGVDASQVERHILTLLLDSGQEDRAIAEVLKPRLARNPKDVATLLMLASTAFDRGDLDLTIDCHRKRITLDPANAEAHYGLAVVAWKFSYYNRVPPELRRTLLAEGVQEATRATELRADYADALTYVNLLYREMEKYARSETERRDYRTQYTEYEARAKLAREAQRQSQPAGGPS